MNAKYITAWGELFSAYPNTLEPAGRLSFSLTLAWQSPLSYGNQPIYLICKSIEWFLYNRDHRHGRLKRYSWGVIFLFFEKPIPCHPNILQGTYKSLLKLISTKWIALIYGIRINRRYRNDNYIVFVCSKSLDFN